jgi:putative phosphonate metabolism protein
MSSSQARYAIYFAPEARTPLWQFGSAVLGYDAASGRSIEFPAALASAVPDWAAMTEDPRRYGFHATLKAPFRLRDGVTEADFVRDVAVFAAGQPAFALDGLAVRALGRFIALTPVGDVRVLSGFASTVVKAFEHVRGPLTEADMAKRLKSPLTDRQRDYLERFGYPYVHDEFRFHMTLTNSLTEARLAEVKPRLEAHYSADVPHGAVWVDRIAIYRQDEPEARFRIITIAKLAGAPGDGV